MLAHADALVCKRADARVVCDAVRDAAHRSTPPILPAAERERLGAMLDDQDLSLAALLLARRPLDHIGEVTGRAPDEVEAAVERILRRLVPGRDGSGR